jgi:hypothetical protein
VTSVVTQLPALALLKSFQMLPPRAVACLKTTPMKTLPTLFEPLKNSPFFLLFSRFRYLSLARYNNSHRLFEVIFEDAPMGPFYLSQQVFFISECLFLLQGIDRECSVIELRGVA